jgi:hypothetical protein
MFFEKLFAPIPPAGDATPQAAPPARPTPEELLRPQLQRVLQGWTLSLERVISIAKLERRNHTIKTLLTQKNVLFPHLAACSVLKAGQGHHKAARARAAARARQDDVHETAVPRPVKPKRAMGPSEIFRRGGW